MPSCYTDNPHNVSDIFAYVITDRRRINAEIHSREKCYFYDTCSFRRHVQLDDMSKDHLLEYVKNKNGIIIITRTILMELASNSGELNSEYIEYIKKISNYGISILLIYEEDLFWVLDVCFSNNETINEHLCWAVRNIKSSVSTITYTLEKNKDIEAEILKLKNKDTSVVYQRFFDAVRKNKESGDNLGEEMIAICLYILSKMPGYNNGKYCIITEDKSAAAKINKMFEKIPKVYKGSDVGIYSTPKLAQILFREQIIRDKQNIEAILSAGISGNITVLGTLTHDIRPVERSFNADELSDLIIQRNGINILF